MRTTVKTSGSNAIGCSSSLGSLPNGVVLMLNQPETEEAYQECVTLLDQLFQLTGGNEEHPISIFIEAISELIERYEATHSASLKAPSPTEALQYLMDANGLTQKDLPELGPQGVVSELLNGKRSLNLRQIKALCQRFHLSAAQFIEV